MIMNKIRTAVISLSILVASVGVFGQEKSSDKLLKARILLNDYQDASKFRNPMNGAYNPAWESIFRDCFNSDKVIFDVPLRARSGTRDATNDGKETNAAVNKLYLEYVSIDQYIETIRSAYDRFNIVDFNYFFIESGFDTTGLTSANKLVFEIEKRFENTDWSVAGTKKYLFTIQFIEGEPKITSVRLKEEAIAKTEVVLTFVYDQNRKRNAPEGQGIGDVESRITIDFEENINDRYLIDRSDSTGRIKLGLVANRARIRVDTVYGLDGVKYSLPSEWKKPGPKVNLQPVGGFRVPLKPYKWNGITYSVYLFGGGLVQSDNNLSHFSGESSFTNKMGYKYGLGFDVAYFINQDNWTANSGNWIFGLGTGISVSSLKYSINSDGFSQNPYELIDLTGDTAMILYSGYSFNEVVSATMVSFPVYLEIRKKLHQKIFGMRSFSFQAGVNLMLPFLSNYDAEGVFSRHGKYGEIYGNQVITDDPVYNYYTDQQNTYSDDLEYKSMIAEAEFKLTGFFDVFNDNPNNTLNIGVLFSLPFTQPTKVNPEDYMISTGNDQYSSLTYSKKNIYDFFFGLSVGINFVKYKVD